MRHFWSLVFCDTDILWIWYHKTRGKCSPLEHNKNSPSFISSNNVRSSHNTRSLWDIFCHWYFVTMVSCGFGITEHSNNAPYTQRNKHSPRVFTPPPTSDHLPPLSLVHLLSLVCCDDGILWIWYNKKTPTIHPTYNTSRILVEFSLLNQRPITSHHYLWNTFCDLYVVALASCEVGITNPTNLYGLQMVSFANCILRYLYLLRLVSFVICIFCKWWLLQLVFFAICIFYNCYLLQLVSFAIGIFRNWYRLQMIPYACRFLTIRYSLQTYRREGGKTDVDSN